VKPLIIMTPKSLLRAEWASSPESDFTSGHFEEILPAPRTGAANKADRIILCSGKVYYDLLNYRAAQKIENTAIIRVEQLYPLDKTKLRALVKAYPRSATLVWCQEESQNMGAWTFMEPRLREMFKKEIGYAGRDASASPAVGSLARHKREQAQLIDQAFTI
jgi:2-oxoglutarate dehydrogenase E1 component